MAARTDMNSHLTVEVLVNGAGPFRFVVDTGAERSVLCDSIADQLGLQRGRTIQVDGLARTISADTVVLAELSFGQFKRKGLRVPVLPRALLGCDGYLGLDAINRTCVTFDFAHNSLRVDSGQSSYAIYDRRNESTRIELSGSEGRLRATDCWVDGVNTATFIDTGAEFSIGNPALLKALNQGKKPPVDLGQVILVGVTGGKAEGRIIPVRDIRMEALKFSNGTLAIADVPNFANWGLAKRPALMIGMDFLRQFGSVSIDYRSREVRFDLAGAREDGPPKAAIARGVAPSDLG